VAVLALHQVIEGFDMRVVEKAVGVDMMVSVEVEDEALEQDLMV